MKELTVQDLIDALNKIEDKTLPVCTIVTHEYWGEVYCNVEGVRLDPSAQPDGPKHGVRPAVVLEI